MVRVKLYTICQRHPEEAISKDITLREYLLSKEDIITDEDGNIKRSTSFTINGKPVARFELNDKLDERYNFHIDMTLEEICYLENNKTLSIYERRGCTHCCC